MKRELSENSDTSSTTSRSTAAPLRLLKSLTRTVSPPPKTPLEHKRNKSFSATSRPKPASALVEAGQIHPADQIEYWSSKLLSFRLAADQGVPRLDHYDWVELYKRNAGSDRGHHFVVHQHDHPVAGTHYDLRLQCNATSSISFAIMYGLPGDMNSRRLNRNATETRVHNLWNHLIETASHETGTMLLWDTGEYEVLLDDPNESTYNSDSDNDTSQLNPTPNSTLSEPEKLHRSFQRRKLKLRLHGTRLPKNYTLSLRLTQDNFRSEQPRAPSYRRRKKSSRPMQKLDTTDDEQEQKHLYIDPTTPPAKLHRSVSSLYRHETPPLDSSESTLISTVSDDENELIRQTNAYTGATNSINSIHQRRWFLSIDRSLSGFHPTNTMVTGQRSHNQRLWARSKASDGTLGGWEKFHVLGRDVERSVVTGRLARDILEDEGIQGYVPRGFWRGIQE